jgi:hypothetical protein
LESLSDEDRPPEPEVPIWAEPAWRAWTELGSERSWVSVGVSAPMGGTIIQAKPGLIPWSKTHEWCDRARYGESDREFIVVLVAALDKEFLADWARRQTKQKFEPPDDKLSRWDRMEDGGEV